jgi:hypothetical protein
MKTSKQINDIFETNKINDLQSFLYKRKCLNNCNIVLIYLFHIIQSTGILVTTIATGYNIKEYIWLGVGLNICASVIHFIEKTNNNLSVKLLSNISLIKKNNYIDESVLIDVNDEQNNVPKNESSHLLDKNLLDKNANNPYYSSLSF